MKFFLPLFLAFLIPLSSCKKNGKDSPPYSEDRFVNLYADLMVLREEGIMNDVDSATHRKKTDSLYHFYEIDSVQLRNEIGTYNKEATRWKDFFEKVSRRLETLKQTTGEPGANAPLR